MSLYRLIGSFLGRHWSAYASSGVMLAGIALLTVWIPRQVGHMVDALVADRLGGGSMVQELLLLVAAGAVVYFLRVGWRLQLYAAAATSSSSSCTIDQPPRRLATSASTMCPTWRGIHTVSSAMPASITPEDAYALQWRPRKEPIRR